MNATATTWAGLNAAHRRHLTGDGWNDQEIAQAIAWGVRSVNQAQASELLGYPAPSGGIWFPFTATWGQLRPDIRRNDGPKYLSPRAPIGTHAVWVPPGYRIADVAATTEGWKDAAIATIRSGRPVAAIAGVSHVRKALPKGLGCPLLFDSDAWVNAQVMAQLIHGGKWLGAGVAIIPGPPSEKWGATEYFSHGGHDAQAFQAMLAAAVSPRELLSQWCDRLLAAPLELPKHCDNLGQLYRKIGGLFQAVGHSNREGRAWCDRHRRAYRRAWNRQQAAQQVVDLSQAQVGHFEALPLPPAGQRRLYALNGQKGTGKSSAAIRGLLRAAQAADLSMIIYAPTRFLARDMATRLGIACHLDGAAATARWLVTCPESAHKTRDRQWDVVAIDEINECLPRAWGGQLGKQPKAAREAIAAQLAAAQVVVAAQDGLYRPTLAGIQRMAGMDAQQAQIIQRRRPQGGMAIRLYHADGPGGLDAQYHGWLAALLDAIERGKRVAIPTGSRGQGRRLYRLIRKRFPGKRIACIDGRDSFASLRSDFAKGSDDWIAANQPDVLIYSPVFNSGVSIERPYFTAQFEYSSPLETATAASQRGERVRAAIGGGLISERHVFIQRRGLDTDPPPEIFTTEYWAGLLATAAQAGVAGVASQLKAIGLEDLAQAVAHDAAAPIQAHPELAAVLAIQAREIHFKAECLLDEWETNGWAIADGAAADETTAAAQRAELMEIRESILSTQAGALASAPSIAKAPTRSPQAWGNYGGGGDPLGPIEAAKFTRWDTASSLGDMAQMNDPMWWAAFHLEGRGAVKAALLRSLLTIKWNQPQLWGQIMQWRALRAVAKLPQVVEAMGGGELPLLPATPSMLAAVDLLGSCPGIQQVAQGELATWDNATPQVIAAHKWAVKHAQQLAAFSQSSQRWLGFQFTEKTYCVAAFHKLLAMVGIEAQGDGQRGRRRQYRPQRVADVDRAIQQAMERGRNVARLERDRYRAQHFQAVVDAAQAQAMLAATPTVADGWAAVLDAVAHNFSRGNLLPTEVVCPLPNTPDIGPFMPPPDADTWAELREMVAYARHFAGDTLAALRETVVAAWGGDVWRDLVTA